MQTIGLNAEWSQELKLEQSLEEYVKGAMLVEMLQRGPLTPGPGFGDVVYDLSVGYDLAGIRSEGVLAFIQGMRDATSAVDHLRRELPGELRDLDYPTRLSDTVTLSTFHGCPPDEIEKIIEFLMREVGLHCIVKFNPMLLGPQETRRLLYDEMGYHELTVPDSAFERDTTWEQAVDFVGRLADGADGLGLGFGVKFSNTLIVENSRGFLAPDEREVYLSGPPLHVLAMRLVRRFRRVFGDRLPISFAAGIDRVNFPDAVALGLVPITVCSDLLKKNGYGRLRGYYAELERRMAEVAATDVDGFVLRAYGKGLEALRSCGVDEGQPIFARCRGALAGGGSLRHAVADDALFERWVAAARLLNTEHYAAAASVEPRYSREGNSKLPRKIGSHLELFDCITCDICVPVCPNDANFTFGSDQREIPVVKLERQDKGWRWRREESLKLERRHQIANFADFCNDCGNCDIFCPEDGGPYVMKPRFFGSEEAWSHASELDGFYLERRRAADRVLGRFAGREHRLVVSRDAFEYATDGVALRFDPAEPETTLTGEGPEEIDLTYCFLMDYLRRALLDSERVNYVNALTPESPPLPASEAGP